MTEYITDLGIAIAGSVDSGKSTFVGVITSGELDNGNGSARSGVAKHPHEITSGKTSDISNKHMFIESQKRAITLIDLCGHEKYFKTTAYGIAGHYPDYAIIIVGANRGILQMTKQHFTLLMSMNIPMIIVITRPDITPNENYIFAVKSLEKYCKDSIKIPAEIINLYNNETNNSDTYKQDKLNFLKTTYILDDGIKQSYSSKYTRGIPYIPMITVSNKTGYYIDFVKEFISNLQPRNIWNNFKQINTIDDNIQLQQICSNRVIKAFMNHMDNKYFKKNIMNNLSIFYIDDVYNPPGIGIVVTGINRGNDICVGDSVYIGPINKDFMEVRIKSIHNFVKQKVNYLKDHYRGTIAIGSNEKEYMTKHYIHKGMILIKNKELMRTNLCFRFSAAISVFNHSATLKNNYTPMIQIGNVRQSARMIFNAEDNNGKDYISSKDYAYVTFKFINRPEFIEPYQVFVFRSDTVHGVGVILDILPMFQDSDPYPDPRRKSIKIRKF